MEFKASISNEMFEAVRLGNIEMVRKIIEKYGLYYSSAWEGGYNLLLKALENRHLEIAKLLITRGCAVNEKDGQFSKRRNIYNLCISYDDIEMFEMILKRRSNINIPISLKNAVRPKQVIELLLNYGAHINTVYFNNGTLLHQAVDKRCLETIEYLLNIGANINSVCTWHTEKGITPLHIAVKHNCKEAVRLLLRRGADVNFDILKIMECKGSLNEEMFASVRNGNIEMVRKIIEKYGLYYSSAWKGGYNLLLKALKNRHLEIAKLLITRGCAVNEKDGQFSKKRNIYNLCILHDDIEMLEMILKRGSNNNIAISLAARPKRVIELLLEYGADINAVYSNYGTLLHQAVDKRCLETIEYLLNRGANINIVCTWHTEKEIAPLHIALKYNCEEIVKLLLRRGADVNLRTQHNLTPLLIAIQKKNEILVKLLLQRGANIEPQEIVPNTAFREAVKRNHLGIVKQILQYCPDINNQCSKYCLRIAIKDFYNKDIVESLLEYGFSVHPEDANDAKLLHASVKHGHLRVIEDLLKYGANVNVLHKAGLTPLHTAAQHKQKEAVELLIKYGANINTKGPRGETPIFMALKMECLEIVNIFLNLKANIDPQPDLLCLAVKGGYKEIIETLLIRGFDVNASNWEGYTALHYTAIFSYDNSYFDEDRAEVAKLLITKGANVNAQDHHGNTTLHYACSNEFPILVKTLLYYESDINIMDSNSFTPLEIASRVYFENDYNPYETNKALIILGFHVIKLKMANLFVNQENLEVMKDINARYTCHEYECKQEIARMKNKTFKNSRISLYEILKNDIKILAKYMNNENIVQELKSNNYKSEFPIYFRMIEINFIKGMDRKKLFDEGKYNFLLVFKLLNDECANIILDMLCASDLQNLKDAFSLSSSL